jgi:hypothetical protein
MSFPGGTIMADRIGGIGQQQAGALRESVQKRAMDILTQQAPQTGEETGAALQPGDAHLISEEAMEKLEGKEDAGGNIDAVLKNIFDMKVQEQKPGEEEGGQEAAEEAQGAQGAKGSQAAGEKQQKEEIKVTWQPLVKEGQVVDTDQPWGHFQISREKKDVDKQQGGDDKGAQQAQGASPKAAQHGGSKQAKGHDGPKGADGKTPAAMQGMDPSKEQQQKLPASNVEMGDGGKCYVIDEATGEKQEIPENGEVKATHPMKIASLGAGGELKPGDKLFTYENPSPEEIEKAKKSGSQGQEDKMGAAAVQPPDMKK